MILSILHDTREVSQSVFKGRREAGFEGGYTLNELTDSRIDLRLLKVLCRGLEGEKKA